MKACHCACAWLNDWSGGGGVGSAWRNGGGADLENTAAFKDPLLWESTVSTKAFQ